MPKFAVYVPWLHMHQPMIWFRGKLIGNLEKMLIEGIYDARKMAMAYANPARYVKKLYKYEPRIMLDFSGTLLESLASMSERGIFDELEVYVDREGKVEVVGNIIEQYREVLSKHPECVEMAGTGYYHPYFPAIPRTDWRAHIEKWRELYTQLFGEKALKGVKGFWLPEMGIPGNEDDLSYLIKLLHYAGYEWLILPSIRDYARCPIVLKEDGNRFKLINEPHILTAESSSGDKESIMAVVREPEIDQQSGVSAAGIFDKALWVMQNYRGGFPPILVPTGDGENGNVMMNEFFPVTFEPFFKEFKGERVKSMCISEYLNKFAKDAELSEVATSRTGGSWVGGHEQWMSGDKRLEMKKKIEAISKKLHEHDEKKDTKEYKEAERAVLLSETSCYVYWNSDFWFEQGDISIALAKKLLARL